MSNYPVPTHLRINFQQFEQMRLDVIQRSPEEACGLILGKGPLAVQTISVTNALHSPVRYRMDPRELAAAFYRMEKKNWQLVAIYHSHPQGPLYPSLTDIREANYPEAAQIIWSAPEGKWRCQAFSFVENAVRPVVLIIVGE